MRLCARRKQKSAQLPRAGKCGILAVKFRGRGMQLESEETMPGWTQILLLLVIILILFGGANKLPQLARSLGKSLGEFKKGRVEAEKELDEAINEKDAKSVAKNATAKGAETEAS